MLAPFSSETGPLVHTYSIVARDATTGEIGAGVQSHWFSVGAIVPWAIAGVGAVVTQSFTNPAFGPEGLRLLAGGRSPREAVEELVCQDEGRDFRQLAIIDTQGRSFAHTGKKCVAEAGHRCGSNFSAQANMMLTDRVWGAMAEAFERSQGPLAERIMTAMEAAEEEGGDARGRQSAAILVVRGKSTGQVWRDRLVDLRVEDHEEPLREMRRLLRVHRAYESMDAGDEAMERGDMEGSLRHYSTAESLFPENEEMVFWHAVALANNGRFEESVPLFGKAFERNGNWKVLLPRLVRPGLIRIDQSRIKELLEL